MEAMAVLESLFRWIHIAAGIMWIGHLYFFNFVNIPFQAVLEGPLKPKVNPELVARALFWFRWGALWTWVTGVLMLLLIFYHASGNLFDFGRGWGAGPILMIVVTFVAFFVYDALAKSDLGKNLQTLAGVGFALVVVIVFAFIYVGGFGYRGYVIHTGAMFGTIMLMNVWMRIWPAQQKILAAVKQAQAPDAALVAMAGARSRHNTYLSVPLVWTMIDSHTAVPFANSPVFLLVMILVGWAGVYWLYGKSGGVKGI
jgi:uncharacterized membrane protein